MKSHDVATEQPSYLLNDQEAHQLRVCKLTPFQ